MTDELVANRYGHGWRPGRRFWWAVGLVAGALAVSWMAWVTSQRAVAAPEFRDVRQVISPDGLEVSLTWTVSVAPGNSVSCALQAKNPAAQIVGWKVVRLGAGDQYTRTFTDTLRNAMPATSGFVYFCWAS